LLIDYDLSAEPEPGKPDNDNWKNKGTFQFGKGN
jgi:hypothetical protein